MLEILSAENEVDREKEHFWCIGLNAQNSIRYIDLVSLGTLTTTLIHPRESFRAAVMKGVYSVMFVHNHPSGDAAPSSEDIKITERLVQAGNVLGIHVLDHIIIGNETGSSASLKAMQII